MRYLVRLDGRPILACDSEAQTGRCAAAVIPSVLKDLGEVPPFDQVLVMQQDYGGNACNGGPLWFLGVNADRSFSVSDEVPFCGGKDPVITRERRAIRVTLPGGPPNRGTGHIPAAVWLYEGGRIRRGSGRN